VEALAGPASPTEPISTTAAEVRAVRVRMRKRSPLIDTLYSRLCRMYNR
jgi:hypothetical protein